MVLNHASVSIRDGPSDEVIAWLRDLSSGMGGLVNANVVPPTLRMFRSIYEIPCASVGSLHEGYERLKRNGFRDEYNFLISLSARAPLLSGVAEEVADRFRSCEEITLPPPDGEPLVLCAIADWIAVGFPTAAAWESDRIRVRFLELLADGTMPEVMEEVDHLAQLAHVEPICERHRIRFRAVRDPARLWQDRTSAFPDLLFGPDVKGHLMECTAHLPTIVGKLSDLDHSAREWKAVGGPTPSWRTKVTPESGPTRKNRTLMRARQFRSQRGQQETFEWHARFGSSGRIHLRFDAVTREVEVGYIGPKLPPK